MGDSRFWWNSSETPRYGDVAAYAAPDGYIYAWGGAATSVFSFPDNQYVYQARVKAGNAFDLSQYEYWWGRDQGWQSEVLDMFSADTAVMWSVGQGQVLFSEHYQTYFFVHMAGGDGEHGFPVF